MEIINTTLANQIKQFRMKKGWTQEELAEKVGVSFQAVSKWENERSAPDIMLLPFLADLFQCTIDALFARERESATSAEDEKEQTLPWKDDGVIRGVVFCGRKLLTAEEGVTDTFTFVLDGDAKNVQSECNIGIGGSVSGGCGAGGDIAIGGDVLGGCNAGGNVAVGGDISGACNVGGEFSVGGDISGNINCANLTVEGDVEATKIKGNVQCSVLRCGNVEGKVTIGEK